MENVEADLIQGIQNRYEEAFQNMSSDLFNREHLHQCLGAGLTIGVHVISQIRKNHEIQRAEIAMNQAYAAALANQEAVANARRRCALAIAQPEDPFAAAQIQQLQATIDNLQAQIIDLENQVAMNQFLQENNAATEVVAHQPIIAPPLLQLLQHALHDTGGWPPQDHATYVERLGQFPPAKWGAQWGALANELHISRDRVVYHHSFTASRVFSVLIPHMPLGGVISDLTPEFLEILMPAALVHGAAWTENQHLDYLNSLPIILPNNWDAITGAVNHNNDAVRCHHRTTATRVLRSIFHLLQGGG